MASLSSTESLDHLNIAGNDLTDSSATFLSHFKNLIYLNCAHCSQISDKGITVHHSFGNFPIFTVLVNYGSVKS